MPSPVAHSLAGLSVHFLTARDRDERMSLSHAAVTVAAAVAPDLDLLLGFLDGRNHHQAESHSIAAALLAAALVGLGARIAGGRRPASLALAAAAGWGSHLLLDCLGSDTHPPIGLPLLWPAYAGYFKFPWPIFLDIGRTLNWHTVRHNALAVAWEMVLMLPILVAAWRWRERRRED